MRDKIRWGILGTGQIAKKFAADLKLLPDAELTAIGSRSREKAEVFAREFAASTAHESYEALLNDKNIDAVYIATPHSCHFQNAIDALNAGKAVLCEKPFTINASETQQVIRLARTRKLLLMEAMWTRFLPIFDELRTILAGGTLGELRMLSADFGFRGDPQKHARLYDPLLGGGALLDIGIYPISLASMVFGTPSAIISTARINEGIDGQNAIVLQHKSGELALLSSTIEADTFCEAQIIGTRGRIKLQSPWWRAQSLTLFCDGNDARVIERPFAGNGYQFEAAEFMKCLREGSTESEIVPLDETLSIMQTLDTIRAQWGLKYPGEGSSIFSAE